MTTRIILLTGALVLALSVAADAQFNAAMRSVMPLRVSAPAATSTCGSMAIVNNTATVILTASGNLITCR